jgi:hypothetical protein
MQQRTLQARMETAEGDTRRRLRIIERQIVSRAERMTVTDCVKRQPRRGASTWTRADERLFQQLVAELTVARRGEIDALTRKLEREELARSPRCNRARAARRRRDDAASRRTIAMRCPGRQRRNGLALEKVGRSSRAISVRSRA